MVGLTLVGALPSSASMSNTHPADYTTPDVLARTAAHAHMTTVGTTGRPTPSITGQLAASGMRRSPATSAGPRPGTGEGVRLCGEGHLDRQLLDFVHATRVTARVNSVQVSLDSLPSASSLAPLSDAVAAGEAMTIHRVEPTARRHRPPTRPDRIGARGQPTRQVDVLLRGQNVAGPVDPAGAEAALDGVALLVMHGVEGGRPRRRGPPACVRRSPTSAPTTPRNRMREPRRPPAVAAAGSARAA